MERANYPRYSLRAATICLVSLATALGALVIIGWHARLPALVQVRPTFVPMQYNTALGFLLGGVGALLLIWRRPRLAVACGAAAGVVGVLTLIEYGLGVDLHVDQLLMRHYILVETSHPGRMAPNTALCFALAGAAILAAARSRGAYHSRITAVVLGSVVASLGSVALFGYLAGVPTAYGWGSLTRMAAHTAVGFVALGAAIVAISWLSLLDDDRWVPAAATIPIAAVGLLTVLGVSTALRGLEHARIAQAVQTAADGIARDLENAVQTQIEALERMANRVGMRPGLSREEWTADAQLYMAHFQAWQAIGRVDATYDVRWIAPTEVNEEALGLDISSEDGRGHALKLSRETGRTHVSAVFDLARGGKGVLAVVPITTAAGFGGFILGVYRVRDLLESAIPTDMRARYDVATSQDGALVDLPGGISLGVADLAAEASATLPGTTLRIRLTPLPSTVANARTRLPRVALVIGIALAALLTAACHLAQTSWNHARETRIANDQLRTASAAQQQTAIALAAREQDAREQAERFRVVFQYAPIGMALLDSSGAILQANDALANMVGYAESDLQRMTFLDITHPDDADEDGALFEKLVARDIPAYEMEKRYTHRNGELVWGSLGVSAVFQDDGALRYAIGMVADITKRKGAEGSLRKLSSVVDQIDDMVVITDTEGVIEHVNPAFERHTGFTLADAAGKTPRILKSGDQDAAFYADLWGTLLAGDAFHAEFANKKKDGSLYYVEKTITPIRDQEGVITHFASTGRDVTERRESERKLAETNRRLEEALTELKEQQERAVQQERLRALGQMASGIAHDLNNSLAPILGFSELLQADPRMETETADRYIHMIRAAAQSAQGTVLRMREFYRARDDDRLLPVDLPQIIAEVIPLTQPQWKDESLARGAPISLHTDIGDIPPVRGNEAELRDALTNLILNACDAMPDGGSITVSVSTPIEGRVAIEVRDTGTGMPDDVRRKCLEPFFTTKGVMGTGMGLATVYGAMQRHGGSVEIESDVGVGTAVRLLLPLHGESDAEDVAEIPDQAVGALTILLVEDDPGVQELIAEYLLIDGHTVSRADNGAEGLAIAREKRLDLVITDRAMPEMSGDQLAAELLRHRIEAPVIMLTGYGAMMDSVPEGVTAVIAKPVTLAQLQTAVAQATR